MSELAAPQQHRRRARLPLGLVLALGLGGLMLLGVGSVLILGISGASQNTNALLRDKADLILSATELRVRHELDPVRDLAVYLRETLEAGRVDVSDEAALTTLMRASLAATPQVAALGFFDPSAQLTGVERASDRILRDNMRDEADIVRLIASFQAPREPIWGAPVWTRSLNQTILPLTMPVYRDGRLLGLIVPTIFIQDLSRFVARFSTPSQTAFILFGRDRVIAHPRLAEAPLSSPQEPLPVVTDIGDPVLGSIWKDSQPLNFGMKPTDSGRVVEVKLNDEDDEFYIYITRELRDIGSTPWIIGTAMPTDEAGREYRRLFWTLLAGLGILALSVLTALLVGKRLARPMRDVVTLTQAVQRFEFDSLKPLPRSRIKELDSAGQALNSMVMALRWFEMYLPRRLVRTLLTKGDDYLSRVEEREVTVIFTDMCGFTRQAGHMEPAAVAAFLNSHFELIGTCVDAEAGTIDKYIGDSVMAFWGAPDAQDDHAIRACRTIRAIAEALRSDNERRSAEGLDPVRIRIGVATGPALVGNIGAKGRINFTLVGDTVNLAQRLEQLGKEIDPDSDIVALIDARTRDHLGKLEEIRLIGEREIRGRDGQVIIFRLI